MKHRHAEIIKLWIDGAHIQGLSPYTDEWIDVPDAALLMEGDNDFEPSPINPEYSWWDNWRVKP
jgi:hypothetical protein